MADLPTHFFKFIPPGYKFKLSIPKSFLPKLNGWRFKTAILRRGCQEWPVHITDGGVFGDGWSKFVTDNGVEEFDFIVFKHQGNMVFDFFVFDQSTCEIPYPNLFDDLQESLVGSDTLHKRKRSKIESKCKSTEYSSQIKDKFQPSDGCCFMTIMSPYSIKAARLSVPIKFARSNGLITKRSMQLHTQIIGLVDESKRSWPATLRFNTDQIHLEGWSELIIKYELKVGDTCMFELVKAGEKPPFFNFYINKETTSTCFFISTLKPYSFKKSILYIPAEFSVSNDLRKGEMILIDDKGRSWNVKLNKDGTNRFCLGYGLRDFWDANGFNEGDVYKFQLLHNHKNKPPVVNFTRSCPLEKQAFATDKKNRKIRDRKQASGGISNVKVESTVSEIKDAWPYYIGELKSYNIAKSMLYLPSEFARKNGLWKKKEMIVKNADERSWVAEIRNYDKYCYVVFKRGQWNDFCEANRLKKGDVFKFLVVSNGQIPVANFYLLNTS
ncbi:hypothetical protein E3N88_14318 [Mikania micrantha]|uniref:TF-B3 domain-containing protein n=1 Tax=Mikania micrantha TaxID=192012 RepID=A0A5N6P2D0_9ASTR|nr:hypothetical protein E3N88_14318 [Mikania micrantha]